LTTAADGPRQARSVVLVEGRSDQVALEALAARRGIDLLASGVVVQAIGGATWIGRYLDRFGPAGDDRWLSGLCDRAEEQLWRFHLQRAAIGVGLDRPGMERAGFFVCDADLEDELIRALGVPAVEDVIAAASDLGAWRTMQKQPHHRGRDVEAQLRRFMGTHSGRKERYARLLVDALDLAAVPSPLDGVLAHSVARPAR
jgi:hypothetical protein